MFLSVRELKFARSRFTLMGTVVALIAILVVLLSGLSTGLVRDGVSGLQRLPVSSFAFAEGTTKDGAFSRSVVDIALAEQISAEPGVTDAAPFGNLLVNAKNQDGKPVDLALFGVEPGSFVDIEAAQGANLEPVVDGDIEGVGIVVTQSAQDEGIELGDVLTLDRVGHTLTVVGFTDGQDTFGHVDVAYVPLEAWQVLASGAKPGEPVRDGALDEVTAIAIAGGFDSQTIAQNHGVKMATLKESFDASPGYTAETMTLTMIQVFLYAISALVVGAFFTVWTMQRRGELAVLRAMGASRGYLVRDAIIQATVILVVSMALGIGLGLVMGLGLTSTPMPFGLEPAKIAVAALSMFVLGLLGAVLSVVRLTKIDPLEALGGSR